MKKPVKLDENGYPKFGFRDKLAYAAGDFGCNMSFALKGTMQVFWTQFMGISLEVMALLMLLVQVWDAINDPLIGSMVDADKHQYKRNKFLQYIWVGSLGLLVAGAACFIPWTSAPMVLKYVLYVLGYILWDAFYTIANVPYGSVMALISNDAGDRAELSSFRSIGSMVGNLVPGVLLPFFIYDATDNLKGNTVFIVALFMGFLGFICFQYMINNTVIRVEQDVVCNEDQPKFNVLKSFGEFFRNRPAVGATLAAVGNFIGMYGASYANTAMWQSYFENAKISGVMQMISYLPMFLFVPFVRKIVAKWGKKEAVSVGAIVTLIGYGSLIVLPITPDAKGIAMWVGGSLVAGIGAGIYQCVSWSLMADAMDYGEWKFGVREEGTVYALHSFFRKLAQGVGPSIGLLVAAALGYVEADKADQAFDVAVRMRYQAAAFYFLGGVFKFIGLFVIYNLDKKTLAKIQSDLAERRAGKEE